MAEASLSMKTWNQEEVSRFVIKEGNGVKGLADMGIPSLPEEYIQPVSERPNTMTVNQLCMIPTIDLSKPTAELEESIWDAAERFGFFQVINHGISLEVLESIKKATFRFFEMSSEEKRKYLKEHSRSNHVRYGSSFSPQIERALEWKDYLSLFFVSREEAHALWPPTCRDELLDYIEKCEPLTKTVMSILMKGLGIRTVDSQMESVLTGSKRVNINYYPKCPNPNLTIGVGRHSDVSTLTILLQDHLGGLYVRSPPEEQEYGSWIHVAPIQGALVINIGDVLQIMSNGKYKSVEHRVVANGNGNRISVPLFINPKPTEMIGPLDQVLAETLEKPKYKHVLYSDYVLNFYRNAHHGKESLQYATI